MKKSHLNNEGVLITQKAVKKTEVVGVQCLSMSKLAADGTSLAQVTIGSYEND